MAFRVLVGLNYGDKRAEPGQVLKDLPEKSVPWLLAQGFIERVKGEQKPNEDVED